MNLEEELSMISDMTATPVAGGTVEPLTTNTTTVGATVQPMPNPVYDAPVMTQTAPVTPAVQPAIVTPVQPAIQPAMVNPAASQVAVDNFNFAPNEFDINNNILNSNPLIRLTGQQGEVFRLHLLPNANPKEVKVHWDQEKGHNFCCLAQAYNTPGGFDKCCGTHGNAKQRFVVPVVLIPSNRGQVQPGVQIRGELKALIVSGKTLQEIKDQAQMSGTAVDQADIIATVDDVRFKTFKYAINPVSTINQVVNLAELEKEWETNATNVNVIKLCGRLITREEYEGGYSSYDYKNYKTQYNNVAGTANTPAQAAPAPGYQQTYPYNYGAQPVQQVPIQQVPVQQAPIQQDYNYGYAAQPMQNEYPKVWDQQ